MLSHYNTGPCDAPTSPTPLHTSLEENEQSYELNCSISLVLEIHQLDNSSECLFPYLLTQHVEVRIEEGAEPQGRLNLAVITGAALRGGTDG